MYNIGPKEISETKYEDETVAEVYLTVRKNNDTTGKQPLSSLMLSLQCEGEGDMSDDLHLLQRSAIYLEGGLFFQAGIDDDVSFPRYSQTGNGQEQGTLTRRS